MRILRWTFLLFALCGCFPPSSWTTRLKRYLYKIYAVFSFIALNSFLLAQILDMVYNVKDTDDFSDNFSVTVVVFVTCFKLITILIRRENILLLCNTLKQEPLSPINTEEFEIFLKFEKLTDWNTLGYFVLLMSSSLCILMGSLLANFKIRKLAFRTWLPYDYSTASAFLLAFAYQIVVATVCTFACVASDTLYSGLLIHISCQFEILEHRLKNIGSDKNYNMKQCVRHHNHIYKYGEMVNDAFQSIMFFQFCTSLSMICFNFYRIMQIEMDSRYIGTLLYMVCSLMQIFYYCWFSNEVKLKSLELSDMIFRSNWTSLNSNVQRAILLVMRRSMKPIEFTSIYIVSVNLDSFMTLLKSSYSAFSVLQQSRESMHKLSLSFALLTYGGYWRPTKWPASSYKYHLYNIYSAFMIFLLYFITFCTCVDSLISKNLKTMSEKFSLCISVLGVSLKVANLFLQRGKIINIMNSLTKENSIPRDEHEKIIQRRNDNYARKLTIYCEILNESAVFFATVGQYKTFINTRTLPVSDWIPYDLSSSELYTISLLYQTVGLLICANASVGNETLIAGLMIQAGVQFEIFCHRVQNLSSLLTVTRNSNVSRKDLRIRYNKIIGDLVRHHLEVYEFVRTVNTVFQYMIFLQFSISSVVLCLSIYKFSTVDPLSMNFVWSGFYLCCMLMQVYLYCWFGNEVTLKSNKVSDAIYEMDWTILPSNVMKDLLLVIARSKKPVKVTSGQIFTLSTESFMKIMKMSYSSFNILKNSTK
ncbi:odorant receptor Or1-like [Apis dorsata]|uniref:odorant receptor Or1-like n=1 Tax=Apis dorsata TaxID=7462 RepID=UPI0012932C60|nr:odorant receptor Or1-like [Apis dorsata]